MSDDFSDLFSQAHPHSEDEEFRNPFVMTGVVTNVNDDMVRIRARIEGMGKNEESDWMMPLLPGSIECTPNVDDQVFVLYVHGDPNRPVYAATVSSKSSARPTEPMLKGATVAAMYNNLAAQFNQLRTDMKDHAHAAGSYVVGMTAVTGTSGTAPTTATAVEKMKDADGAEVSADRNSNIVLSSKCLLRGSNEEK